MPITIPRSVRESWGEEATEDFAEWFDQAVRESAVPRDEYRQILSRMEIIEHDIDDLKDSVAEVNREVGDLRREMNERFDRMNERFDRMNERFDQMYERILVMTRWTIGILALFGTIITILLAIAQFTP